MAELRYYQEAAVQATLDYFESEPGNPLVDMATGTGKSLTMAALTKRVRDGWGDMRVLNVTHVVELVESNFKELVSLWPAAPVGVYAAALGRRDRRAPILFAQMQTIWNKADEIGHVDLLEIDEVHLVPASDNTMYRKLITDLLAINPNMRVAGFSATPYRLDSGRLDEGDDRMFDRVVYEYGIAQGIADGYLTRLTSKPTNTEYDLSGVHRLGGDFKRSELEAALDKADITASAVAETIAAANADNRRCALFFCAGIDHALHVRDEVRTYGKSCETLTGKTPKDERRRILDAFKCGDLWGITNDSIMTTGTNVPRIDLIADMAPTQSCSRYVQKGGRGTRVIYAPGFDLDTVDGRLEAIAAGPKPNCLYLNFARNIERHGPIDMVQPREPGKGGGEAPIKLCPDCNEICHASVRVCPQCGHEFPFSDQPDISGKSTSLPILSSDESSWIPIVGRTFAEHLKVGKPPSVKITYESDDGQFFKEWVCPQHGEDPKGSFAKSKADRWWAKHGGLRPFPATVEEFLDRAGELKLTTELTAVRNGKFWNITDVHVSEERDVAYVRPPKRAGNIADRYRSPYMVGEEDNIPF